MMGIISEKKLIVKAASNGDIQSVHELLDRGAEGDPDQSRIGDS